MTALTAAQQHQIGHSKLLLDQLTKSFIREHRGYRFSVCADGNQALAFECEAGSDALGTAGKYSNLIVQHRLHMPDIDRQTASTTSIGLGVPRSH